MTNKKPDRNVSRMDVLKDIRGLLSASQEQVTPKDARPEGKTTSQAEITSLEEEVKRYKVLVKKQQDEIDSLKSDNKGLAQRQIDETARLKNENKRSVLNEENEIEKLKNENKALVQKRQKELDGLRKENKELLARLGELASTKTKPLAQETGKSLQEIADIEARIAEMSLALSKVEGLVQLKSKELMGRLARVYQEAAQGEIALEFRKGRDELESVENLAHFVQALLGE